MSKKLVLIVEDHKDQNEEICLVVEKTGYKPISAFDGLDAFRQLKKYRRGFGFLSNAIDVIILDWNMPNMRGEEFIKILRRQEHWKTFAVHIPIIILTAYDEEEKRGIAAHRYFGMAAGYLTKPFNPKELEDVLQRILEDKDQETLIEINRENRFKIDDTDLKKQLQEKEHHQNEIKCAFYNNETTEKALEYIEKKKIDADIEFEDCKKLGKADESTIENLKIIKDTVAKEYFKLQNKLSQTQK